MARKNEEIEGAEVLEDADQHASRVYELGFHLDPELPQEEVKKAYQGIRDEVGRRSAIVVEGEPQKVPLAYRISRQETTGRRDFDSAFFAWIAYETSAEKHAEILAFVKEDNHIVRFIDLVTTKDAARHAKEMRDMSLKVPEKLEGADAVSDTELDAALESAAA